MRNLGPTQQSAVYQAGTEPRYFVKINLGEDQLLSTGADGQWQGEQYVSGYLRVLGVSGDRANLEIWNEDYQYTIGAMNGAYLRNRVQVFWAYEGDPRAHYVEPGYWEKGYTYGPSTTQPTAILIFDGIISGTPRVDEWLTVHCARETPKTWPSKKIRPPFANFAPSAGYTMNFDGQTIRIEGGEKHG